MDSRPSPLSSLSSLRSQSPPTPPTTTPGPHVPLPGPTLTLSRVLWTLLGPTLSFPPSLFYFYGRILENPTSSLTPIRTVIDFCTSELPILFLCLYPLRREAWGFGSPLRSGQRNRLSPLLGTVKECLGDSTFTLVTFQETWEIV